MAKRNRAAVSILVVLALLGGALAFIVAGQRDARAETVPEGVFDSLRTLNKKLTKLLNDLKEDKHSTGSYIEEINRIERIKHEMVEDYFGDERVFGLPFRQVYLGLEQTDVLLWRSVVLFDKGDQDRAERKIEAAKKAKDRLEARLREGGDVPEGVFDSLRTLNKKLTKLLNDLKEDKHSTGSYIEEINRIERIKHEMVEDYFGDERVFGLPFRQVYLGLEQTDVLLWRSVVLFDKGDQDRAERKIEAAKKAKDRLEARLREANTAPSPSPSPSASSIGSKPQGGPLKATLSPPNTTYEVAFTDPDGDSLTYDWSETSVTCGTFTPGTANSTDAIPNNQAVWSHPNGTGQGQCPHDQGSSHPGTIVVKVSDGNGNLVRCTYSGSESGEGPPCE